MCASFLEESPIGMLNKKMLMYGLISILRTLLILTQFSGKEFDSKRKKNTLNQGEVVFITSYPGVPDIYDCSYPAISTGISTKISQKYLLLVICL